jgi:hypothetical protein
VLKHCAANRKRRLSALPNVGPYIYDVNISGFTRSSKNDISRLRVKIYKTIIFPVLYGCKTWSLRLREQRWLRVFEDRVLRGIFGPKRDEGEWRKLHNEEHNHLYCSPNIVLVIKSRIMRWVGHVACTREGRDVSRLLVGKP